MTCKLSSLPMGLQLIQSQYRVVKQVCIIVLTTFYIFCNAAQRSKMRQEKCSDPYPSRYFWDTDYLLQAPQRNYQCHICKILQIHRQDKQTNINILFQASGYWMMFPLLVNSPGPPFHPHYELNGTPYLHSLGIHQGLPYCPHLELCFTEKNIYSCITF